MKKLSIALLVLCLPALVSCAGFTPVYATKSAVRQGIEKIELSPIATRNGFTLSQQLFERGGIRIGQNGTYTLKVDLVPRRIGSGVQIDNVATRFEVQMLARWTLFDADGKRLTQMDAHATASFDSDKDPYASQIAEQHGEDRAIAMLADSILDQLGFYFAKEASIK